jgi:hypothetical protein
MQMVQQKKHDSKGKVLTNSQALILHYFINALQL